MSGGNWRQERVAEIVRRLRVAGLDKAVLGDWRYTDGIRSNAPAGCFANGHTSTLIDEPAAETFLIGLLTAFAAKHRLGYVELVCSDPDTFAVERNFNCRLAMLYGPNPKPSAATRYHLGLLAAIASLVIDAPRNKA